MLCYRLPRCRPGLTNSGGIFARHGILGVVRRHTCGILAPPAEYPLGVRAMSKPAGEQHQRDTRAILESRLETLARRRFWGRTVIDWRDGRPVLLRVEETDHLGEVPTE